MNLAKEKNWNNSTPANYMIPLGCLLLLMDPRQTNCSKWQRRPQCGKVIFYRTSTSTGGLIISILNHHLKTWVPPNGTNPLKKVMRWDNYNFYRCRSTTLFNMHNVSTKFSSQNKQLPRIRYGQPLGHARLLSNWNSTWIFIQIRDDRVYSLIENIMYHHQCRHGKKHPLPWLWPIKRYYSLVLDQEYLELHTRVWNIPTYLT